MKKISVKGLSNYEAVQRREAFKMLRTNIGFCGKEIQSIVITSSVSKEGKTTIGLKLAASFAEAGKKVVFIDADMRNSALITKLKNRTITGLSHYLCGHHGINDILYKSQVTDMDIIFAGPMPPNPAELLNGKLFNDLICTLKEYYDYVIIDTPPLGIVIDAAIISRVCDGAVLVIEANKVNLKYIKKVIHQLELTKCRILGTVLNKVAHNTHNYDAY